MKKLWAAAATMFVITGFASTALAGDGNYIFEKMRQDTEQRMTVANNEQANELPCCQDISKVGNATNQNK